MGRVCDVHGARDEYRTAVSEPEVKRSPLGQPRSTLENIVKKDPESLKRDVSCSRIIMFRIKRVIKSYMVRTSRFQKSTTPTV
jgi:hypothetical protein